MSYGLKSTAQRKWLMLLEMKMQRELLKLSYISPEQKAELTNIIGEYDYRLTQGANSDIQLSALLAQFAKIGKLKGEHS